MQTMRRIDVQINGKLVGSCDSISKVSSPLFKDILEPWIDIKGFVPEKPSLNKNQQIVLEWLKEEKEERCSFESAIYWYFEDDVEPDIISDRLTQREFLQVLAAFAQWGMKEVAE
ncbi:hypothetical protein KQI33_02645 [Enterococcus devriesei]|uniref:hypothetical protein n=1 Tax=Enterococcus devriesei TaxID=319970 RepID=UPI001C0F46CF|nr:hypothetical protein [Enterococcus devriesei]MBU5364274.1 hypothetical protein [Enterococcus devriesei]